MAVAKKNAPISLIIPAKNEEQSLTTLLPKIKSLHPEFEIIVVDDGSSDGTQQVCLDHQVIVYRHPYSLGNGAAIKAGVRIATGKILVFMDADGQHSPEHIHLLLAKITYGYDMAIGARNGRSQANVGRHFANALFNYFASVLVGHRIEDLTSGFRAAQADKFREFLHLLPNGFSYPTTSTMAFFRSGYSVIYIPIEIEKRSASKSHIKPLKDGFKFLMIIFKIATLYAPLKIFLPASGLFLMAGLVNYLYTFVTQHRFTNMSTVMFVAAIIVFLIGLVSEQITMLMYQRIRTSVKRTKK